jgi:hypothetical protein
MGLDIRTIVQFLPTKWVDVQLEPTMSSIWVYTRAHNTIFAAEAGYCATGADLSSTWV